MMKSLGCPKFWEVLYLNFNKKINYNVLLKENLRFQKTLLEINYQKKFKKKCYLL